MKTLVALVMICSPLAIGGAEEAASANPANTAAPADRPAPITRMEPDRSAAGADEPRVATEAKWEIAGYNNNEIVFTIYLTSQDPRILRCTTEIQGWYFENGEKQQISDRQITTVFPDQPAQVGNWMGLDQNSGAKYKVRCRPM